MKQIQIDDTEFKVSYTPCELRKNLKVSPLSNGNYLITTPYCVQLRNGDLVSIDKGYQTNGADIPRLLWRLYPPYSPDYLPAVVVHDYLCDQAVYTAKSKQERADLFLYADKTFKELLERLNIGKFKIWAFYNSVRAWHTAGYCLKKV